ncbi:hypothetical protein Goshw_017653, partial [Gossypium schwendimanii]|nr:hypothetical protein [Gossypium schwendimanii]
GFIHNLVKPSITEIRGYLQEVGFLHKCCILEGCKLDPKLINALVERWRLEMHTFHPPCDECTITLEDVALQLDLPMDEPVIIRATIVPSKKDLCAALLGKVPNKFKGGQILMNWLEKNFQKLHSHATEDAKVLLIVYTTVEIYELNQVMLQFEYQRQILQSPRYMKKLHKVDMLGTNDEDW